jgi:hypothetical protein
MFAIHAQECTTLKLLEIDPTKLPGPIEWVVGKMGDPEPTATSATTIHYLIPDGCVHVYVATLNDGISFSLLADAHANSVGTPQMCTHAGSSRIWVFGFGKWLEIIVAAIPMLRFCFKPRLCDSGVTKMTLWMRREMALHDVFQSNVAERA